MHSPDGDAAGGALVFLNNGCGACHCDDASGGCALGAPALIGVEADELDERLRGDASHPVKFDLSDNELADLQAYLGSLVPAEP